MPHALVKASSQEIGKHWGGRVKRKWMPHPGITTLLQIISDRLVGRRKRTPRTGGSQERRDSQLKNAEEHTNKPMNVPGSFYRNLLHLCSNY